MNKIACFLALIAIIQIVSASNLGSADLILEKYMDAPKKKLFKVYHVVYEKSSNYELNSEEGIRRYRIFKDNLNFYNEENKKGHTYTLGITKFTDMTNEEYQKTLIPRNVFRNQLENAFKYQREFLSEAAPEKYVPGEIKVNWKNNFGPVRDQGDCGSCWAFATMGVIEGNYNLKFGETYNLSPQYAVDCDTTNNGCNGGWPTAAIQNVITNGVVLESSYKYVEVKGTCTAPKTTMKIVSDQTVCGFSDCNLDKWLSMLKLGPLEIGIDAGNPAFSSYKGGVLDLPFEGSNHAVVAIGVDSDAGGDFIIVRNSWGPSWGEQGYFRLRINQSTKTIGGTELGWLPTVVKFVPPTPNPSPPTSNPSPTPPTPPTPSPTPVSTCPQFYTDCALAGKKLEVCATNPDLSILSFDWTVSSISIGKAASVNLFSQPQCRGRSGTITQTNNCLSYETGDLKFLNKRSQSATINYDTVPAGCIWVYDGSCFGLGKEEICGDVADLAKYNFDDKISSFRIGANITNVIVFINANYQGLGFAFNTLSGNLDQSNFSIFNNSVSSIKIFK